METQTNKTRAKKRPLLRALPGSIYAAAPQICFASAAKSGKVPVANLLYTSTAAAPSPVTTSKLEGRPAAPVTVALGIMALMAF